MSRVLRAFRISGVVQGVGFREATRAAAERITGLSGYVRNQPDGSVLTVVAGSKDGVEQLLGFLHRGPPSARVAEVVEVPPPPGEQRGAFTVIRP